MEREGTCVAPDLDGGCANGWLCDRTPLCVKLPRDPHVRRKPVCEGWSPKALFSGRRVACPGVLGSWGPGLRDEARRCAERRSPPCSERGERLKGSREPPAPVRPPPFEWRRTALRTRVRRDPGQVRGVARTRCFCFEFALISPARSHPARAASVFRRKYPHWPVVVLRRTSSEIGFCGCFPLRQNQDDFYC